MGNNADQDILFTTYPLYERGDMGIINKVLYQGEALRLSRFNSFFLDMEENIHIHYRDLRIELSRGEFEDFVQTFRNQSDELLKIINDTNYQDGKLPNANKQDVRIWTESRLRHSIKYNATKLSIEECTDGYHLHYRNYKILLDLPEFKILCDAFASFQNRQQSTNNYRDVLNLINANHLDYLIDNGNEPGKILCIAVAHYHSGKVDTILKANGFSSEVHEKIVVYTGNGINIHVKTYGPTSTVVYSPGRNLNNVVLLTDYFVRYEINNDINIVNDIKCQVLDLYWQISNSPYSLPIELDPNLWLISTQTNEVIFPRAPARLAPIQQGEQLLKSWTDTLFKYKISQAKPNKIIFDKKLQTSLCQMAREKVLELIGSYDSVSKIYLMGSASRYEMGIYCAPYAYGKLAKIGSDIDILIEIDSNNEQEIPPKWKLISRKTASNDCAIYHVDEIPSPIPITHFEEKYQNISLTHHLIDAYVFFESHGDKRIKDAFLKQHKAILIHDKKETGVYQGEYAKHLIEKLTGIVDFKPTKISPYPAPTENELFLVRSENNEYILKFHKVAGNLTWDQIPEHTIYEYDLLNIMRSRGLKAPSVASQRGATIDGKPILVLDRIIGNVLSTPPFPIEKISELLANFHQNQLIESFPTTSKFTFNAVWGIWIKSFFKYWHSQTFPADLAETYGRLYKFAEKLTQNAPEKYLFTTSPEMHLQGDVTPRNFISGQDIMMFDYNNAYYGPRMIDVMDGAFEFALATPPSPDKNELVIFDNFIATYQSHSIFSASELSFITDWILVVGLIKFTKEVKMILENNQTRSRLARAARIAECIFSKVSLKS